MIRSGAVDVDDEDRAPKANQAADAEEDHTAADGEEDIDNLLGDDGPEDSSEPASSSASESESSEDDPDDEEVPGGADAVPEPSEFVAHMSSHLRHALVTDDRLACGRVRGPGYRPCALELPVCHNCTVALVRASRAEHAAPAASSSSSDPTGDRRTTQSRLRQKTVMHGPGPDANWRPPTGSH